MIPSNELINCLKKLSNTLTNFVWGILISSLSFMNYMAFEPLDDSTFQNKSEKINLIPMFPETMLLLNENIITDMRLDENTKIFAVPIPILEILLIKMMSNVCVKVIEINE